MKKLLLTIIFLAVSGTLVFSGDFSTINQNSGPKDSISLIYGDPSCLNDPDAKIALIISFEEAQIVDFDREYNVEKNYGSIEKFNEERGEQYVRDWPQNYVMMCSETAASFDKVFKSSIRLATEAPDARYGLIVRLGQFDFGHFVAIGSIKDGGTITKGIIEIIELKTDKTVAVFDLNYHRSKNVGYGNNDRLREYGKLMAKEIKKIIKK